MDEGWLELESDPGLFTLLLEDFGVQGVQVEEIYDLQTKFEGPVYGFIFLFKWIEERRARRKVTCDEANYAMDEDIVKNIFFAKQIINNSCATHALLSVLLNCNNINLGPTLTHLKGFTHDMNAEDKGLAITNMPDLARAHNSHARPEPYRFPEKQQGISVRTGEAFHFVSYVAINGRLYELDGLQPFPIDHGPWKDKEEWTEHFRRVISERLGMSSTGGNEPYHDIRFNLMAVVPNKRQIFEQKLKTLKTNRQIILDTLQQILDAKKMVAAQPVGDDEAEDEEKIADPFSTYKTTDGPQQKIKSESKDSKSSSSGSAVEPMDTTPAMSSPSLAQSQAHQPAVTVRTSARLKAKGSAYSNAFAVSTTPTGGARSNTPNAETDSINSLDSDSVFQKGTAVKGETESDVEVVEGVSGDPLTQNIETQKKKLQHVENSDVKFHISVSDEKEGSVMPTTLALTDVTKPLSIQTKFGNLPPGPGTGSSTDTASEFGGSCLSSPVCSLGQPSPHIITPPNTSFPRSSPDTGSCGIERMRIKHETSPLATTSTAATAITTACVKTESPAVSTSSGASGAKTTIKTEPNVNEEESAKKTLETPKGKTAKTKKDDVKMEAKSVKDGVMNVQKGAAGDGPLPGSGKKKKKKFGGHHGFTPKDLLQLLSNVDNEISSCENSLKEERDKYEKYKVDASRRTHNYDQFICTFLSMLAEQGHVTKLVEEQNVRRKSSSKNNSKNTTKPKTRKR